MISETEKSIDPVLEVLPEGEVSLLDLLVLLVEKKRFILLSTLGASVLTAAVCMILPVRYTGESSLMPPQQSSTGAGVLSQLVSGGGGALAAFAGSSLGIKSQNDTYIAMFKSRTVEDAMVKRFDLMKEYHVKAQSDARRAFERRSTAVAGLKDGIIRITVDDPSPDKAAAMANAFVEEFQRLASNVATTEAGQRRVFFERQLEDAKNSLANAEQDLKKSELKTGLIQPESESWAMIQSAATIQGQIAAKEVQLQGMSSYATDNNPDVITVRRQLDELRAQLTRLTGNASSESELFVPKGKVPEAALEYVRNLREVKYRETIFQALATQYQLAKLDEAKQGAVFQIIDVAVPPDKRSFPKRTVLVIIFTLLAFIFACFAVWVRAAFESLRRDPENGPKIAALRVALRQPRA